MTQKKMYSTKMWLQCIYNSDNAVSDDYIDNSKLLRSYHLDSAGIPLDVSITVNSDGCIVVVLAQHLSDDPRGKVGSSSKRRRNVQ